MGITQIKMNVNLNGIYEKYVNNKDVLTFANSTAHKKMSPYTPYQYGETEEDVIIDDTGIEYRADQARFLYFGKLMLDDRGSSWARKDETKHVVNKDLNFSKEQHPLATKEWDKAMMIAKGDELTEEIESYIKKKGRANG